MEAAIGLWGVVWSLIGLVLLAVAAYESVPALFKRLRHRIKFKHGYKPYFGAAADEYRGQSWPAPMFHEFFEHVRVEWAPLVGWRHAPLSGAYHNFDAEGRRRTWNAKEGGAPPRRVFMFGGSTVMGMGARDDATVPSLLSRKLAESGHRVEVTNYGQLGYVLAQEVILLVEELKKGRIPDLALFTDGLNEVMTAEHHGAAGRVWQEHNRRQEFNLIQPYRRPDFLRQGARALVPDTAKALGLFEPAHDAPARLSGAQVERLADDVLGQYAWNIRLVGSLARQFKFRVIFFWQPAIFIKKNTTEFEEKLKREGDTPLFRAVYGRRRETLAQLENAVDLAGVFEDVAEGVYYDAHHLTEGGNARMADAMLPHVTAALKR